MALKKCFRVEGSDEGTVTEAKEFLQRPYAQLVSWDTCITWAVRLLYIIITVIAFIHRELLQIWVNQLWAYLLTSWIFNCVYFETWWTVISYIVAFFFPWLMNQFSCFKKYRIDPSVKWKSYSLVFYFKETVFLHGSVDDSRHFPREKILQRRSSRMEATSSTLDSAYSSTSSRSTVFIWNNWLYCGCIFGLRPCVLLRPFLLA